MKPSVAVIIVTYNSGRFIVPCLKSLQHTSYGGTFDVCVVDNASSDRTVGLIREHFPEIAVTQMSENTGFVGGNNHAMHHALKKGYEYIVLLNADTDVESDWLEHLIAVAQKTEAGIVQANLLLGEHRSLLNNLGNALHYLGFGFVTHYREPAAAYQDRESISIGYASGAAMAIRRAVLERVGVFDDKFFSYHEDLDLCWRARLAGYAILLAPRARVYHYHEFSRNKKMFFWSERNRWFVLLQNYSVRTLCLLLPMLLCIEVLMLFYGAFSGQLGAKLKSYLEITASWRSIITRRRTVARYRAVHDRNVFEHMEKKMHNALVRNPIVVHLISPMTEAYYAVIKKIL